MLTKDNIDRLLIAIGEFGFGSLGLQADDLLNPANMIQLGYEPYWIDLLTDVTGVDFQDCYGRKATVTIDQIQVNFLNLDDLIQAKWKAGRLQDLADSQQLEKIKKKKNKKEKMIPNKIRCCISHRRNLLTKFEVTNTAALINLTMKHGLL